MKTLVIYDSHQGNTRLIAEAIADVLRPRGQAEVVSVTDAPTQFSDDIDLVVVGGPTEGHAATPAIVGYFDELAPHALARIPAAAFDTRVGWPRILSGSAAVTIAHRLTDAGARLVAPPESFIVSREPQLEDGEVRHATTWATTLADSVAGGGLVALEVVAV
jgi:flavodoxin